MATRNLVTPKGKLAITEGLPELHKRIADVLEMVGGKEVKKVWMRGAIVIRDEARRLAPFDANPATRLNPKQPWHTTPGLLKRAIYAAYGKDTAPNVLVGVNYKLAGFAHWIEFGTADRTTGDIKGKSTGNHAANRGHVTPHPYMRPALATKRAEAIAVIAQGYRELIEKAAT